MPMSEYWVHEKLHLNVVRVIRNALFVVVVHRRQIYEMENEKTMNFGFYAIFHIVFTF